jgi:hypothetical protein
MKHTPGPWKAEKVRHAGLAWNVRASDVNTVAQYMGEDDAILTAAGPELLAAAQLALQFIENGVEFGYITLPTPPDPALNVAPMLRAAIAKARSKEA